MKKVTVFKTCELVAGYGLMDPKTRKAIYINFLFRFITAKDAVTYAAEHGYKVDGVIHMGGRNVTFDADKLLQGEEEESRIEEEIYRIEHGGKKISEKPKFAARWASREPTDLRGM